MVRARYAACALLQPDHADHQRDVVDLGAWQLEGLIVGIVAEDGERFIGGALLHALDERPLLGVEHIYFVPLEEGVQRHTLAGHDVAAVVLGYHGGSFDGNEELSIFEGGYHIAVAFQLQHHLLAREHARHGIDGDEWDALAGL